MYVFSLIFQKLWIMANPSATPRNTLNLRIKPEETLLESTTFLVSPEAYAEFLRLLDAPAQPNERLRKTMQTRAPWD
jgi:uncharacterized protein (DUF1778 family)